MNISGFPVQRKAKADKTTQWCKDTINALINNSEFGGRENRDLDKLYRYYSGNISDADYSYVTDPYKFQTKRNYPAKLRNYNIIKPVVDLLLGEKAKRPRNISIISVNPDAVGIMKQEKQAFVKTRLQDHFVHSMQTSGLDAGLQVNPVDNLQDEAKQFELSYTDKRAVKGQNIYSYLNWQHQLSDLYQEAFKDWLVAGKTITYKEPLHGDVDYTEVEPSEFDHDRNPSLRFIEDGAWAVRRVKMSVAQIIDRWHDLLTEDQIDMLEHPSSYDGEVGFRFDVNNNELEISTTDNDQFHYVYHTVWKTLTKIGILTYMDEMGQVQQMEVSEDYQLSEEDGDIDIEYIWVNEVWHGFRIGRDIFLKLRDDKPAEAFPIQRGSLNNPSDCKLPYNGRAQLVSPVELGIPYQELYNIFHYRLELSIAKNKDKIALFDINQIPKKKGWDEERFMFMAEAAGFAFIDPTAENAQGEKTGFNNYQVLDMSLGQYIQAQFQLLNSVQDEFESALGISRQRKGNIMASDGRGTTERAVFQSSVMSEEMFRQFEEFERMEAQGLVDTGKIAYKDGKKATYLDEEGNVSYLEVDPEDVRNMELGVAASNSAMDYENIQTMKQLSLEFVQGGMQASSIAELLESKSMAKIKQKLLEAEQAQRAWEEKMKQMDQQTAQMQLDAQKEDREDKQGHEAGENALDREKDILIKQMDISAKDGSDDGADEKLSLDRQKFEADRSMKEREQSHKERVDNKKLEQEDKKISIARQKNAQSNSKQS